MMSFTPSNRKQAIEGRQEMFQSNLQAAKRNKNDEFYTQLSDIENELRHYRPHFKDKVVYMNCDDPEESNFWKFFKAQFEILGLKKIISTHYDPEKSTYKLEYDGNEVVKTDLDGNGDFRSAESIELLKEADIVVTNPPFSLYREYVAQLTDYEKDFLILGNNNSVTYKEIFPLIKDRKMWLGTISNKTLEFGLPDDYEKWSRVDDKGRKYGKVPAISWFTNLDIPRRHEKSRLWKRYHDDPSEFPKYDNYDAIEVGRVANIPFDYDGVMGVPITYLGKHNPDEFEIMGMTKTPICFDNKDGAKRTRVFSEVTQISKGGKQTPGNKVNDASVLILDNPPNNKTYYVTSDVGGYLVAQYPRVLIRKTNSKEGVKDTDAHLMGRTMPNHPNPYKNGEQS